MVSSRIAAIFVALAFVSGAFIASPELRAYAAATITSADIVDGTIRSTDIGSGEVKTSDIGNGQVTSAKIKDGNVMTSDLANDAVTSDKLADNVLEDLQGQIDDLTAENAAQQAEIDDLISRIEALEGDDAGPTPISIEDRISTEGDAGTTSFQFTVTRSGDLSGTSTVDYATADGTVEADHPAPATSDSDYQSTSGTLTFLAGEASTFMTVQVNGDEVEESAERFFVNLSNCVGCTISDAQADGIIANDD